MNHHLLFLWIPSAGRPSGGSLSGPSSLGSSAGTPTCSLLSSMAQEPRDCYKKSVLATGYFPWGVTASLAPMEVFIDIIKAHMLVAAGMMEAIVADTTITTTVAVGRIGVNAEDKVIVAARLRFAACSSLRWNASDSGRLGSWQLEADFH